MPLFKVREQMVHYDPEDRRTWAEGGSWPHSNGYGFHEAVVAAHFKLRGYHALHDYALRVTPTMGRVTAHFTRLFHDIIGGQIVHFLAREVVPNTKWGGGQPDLFVFREERPGDPKIRYSDPLLWFFVEVKGANEQIGETQKLFWRIIAEKAGVGLGPERIRLYRVLPLGTEYAPMTFEY